MDSGVGHLQNQAPRFDLPYGISSFWRVAKSQLAKMTRRMKPQDSGRAVAVSLCLVLALVTGPALARENANATGQIAAADLPQEGRDTLALIKRGGPFRHRQDDSVFGNREKRLPARARGYYREYTVPTPGARDRGARRIVAGSGAGGDVRTSGEYYYTDDHYNSFRRIKE